VVLSSQGIPKDVLLEWDATERIAAMIVLGQKDGNEFDWREGRWMEKH
jgi:hypothetical protein